MFRFRGMSRHDVMDLELGTFLSMVPWDLLKEAEKAGGMINFLSYEQAERFFESMGMET